MEETPSLADAKATFIFRAALVQTGQRRKCETPTTERFKPRSLHHEKQRHPNATTITTATSNVTTLPATPKPQTSKEVIVASVQLLIEQLEAGHSEGLTAYLSAMGKFHNFSFGNILRIARQRPDATRVAGLYAWNQLAARSSRSGFYPAAESWRIIFRRAGRPKP